MCLITPYGCTGINFFIVILQHQKRHSRGRRKAPARRAPVRAAPVRAVPGRSAPVRRAPVIPAVPDDHGNNARVNDGHNLEANRNNDGDGVSVDELSRMAASINGQGNVIIGDNVLNKLRKENIECYMLKKLVNKNDTSILREAGMTHGAIMKLEEYFESGAQPSSTVPDEKQESPASEYEQKIYNFVLIQVIHNGILSVQGINKGVHGQVQGDKYKAVKQTA